MKKKNIFLVKFTVVAAMIGFFSPSVNIKTNVEAVNGYNAFPLQLSVSLLNTAEARARGGARGGAKSRPTNKSSRKRSGKKSRNRSNKNVNVNVNHRYHGGHRRGYYRGRPIIAFATVVAIGSIISASTMPKTCTSVVHAGVSYKRCDNAYYQPFYEGDTLVYKAVVSPY